MKIQALSTLFLLSFLVLGNGSFYGLGEPRGGLCFLSSWGTSGVAIGVLECDKES